jgi:invasion protein IalB
MASLPNDETRHESGKYNGDIWSSCCTSQTATEHVCNLMKQKMVGATPHIKHDQDLGRVDALLNKVHVVPQTRL